MAARLRCFLTLVAILAISGGFHTAGAATHVVFNTNDAGPGSLRQALAEASDGDVITFALDTPARIVLSSGELVIDKSVTIIGPGADQLTIDAAFSSRVFRVRLTGFDFATGTVFPIVRIEHLTITGGFPDLDSRSGTADGGGIWNQATLTVEHCVFTENVSQGAGGAILSGGERNTTDVTGSLTVRNSSFFSNYAPLLGGAIAVKHTQARPDIFGGAVSIVNSTFSNNLVAMFSEGSHLGISAEFPGSQVRIANSTFYDDFDANGLSSIYHFGVGFASHYSTLEIANSIIVSFAEYPVFDAVFAAGSLATSISGGYNLFSFTAGLPPSLDLVEGDQLAAVPLLDTLQENGGSTPTHALLPGSPAVDAGDPAFDPTAFEPPLLEDQRGAGFARISNGRIDIGAFEVQATSPPPPAVCPSPQGFWKNNSDVWPVTALTLGARQYSSSALLALLALPRAGDARADASLILAVQLIAAKLNVSRGSDASPIATAIANADGALAANGGTLPLDVRLSSPAGRTMVAIAAALERYNRGELTPSCSIP